MALAQTYVQESDPDFDTSVRSPTYTREHPVVVIDEAHHNIHTMHGRYEPLARVLQSDGYKVLPGENSFTRSRLKTARVLLISNAAGGEKPEEMGTPAFTQEECAAVEQWVRGGGSLLLIADHKPMGSAARDLALRFGVDMGLGYVVDLQHSQGNPTFLVFSEKNGLLGDSAIINGRNEAERVRRVVAFTGQSLSIPRGAIALLKLAPSALDVDSDAGMRAVMNGEASPEIHPVQDGAQAVALRIGKGRIAVFGEAALFSAQRLKQDGKPDFRFGMNVPGNDDKQLALNVLHWLSGALN
jgi:hypothetical protein